MTRVVDCLHQRMTHQAGTADHAIEPGVISHLDDGRDATAFFPDHDAVGTLEFDFTAGVGAVAQLVLQALHQYRILAAIGTPARHEKARQAAIGACQHHMRIAHRCREKPFVSGQRVFRAAPGAVDRAR